MFSGKYDRVVDIRDNRKYSGLIEAVIEHNELEADHLSFLTGKDTRSYLDRVIRLMKEFDKEDIKKEAKKVEKKAEPVKKVVNPPSNFNKTKPIKF